MVSKGADHVVLWPQYFDVRLSRAEGRRVAKPLAVKDPDVQWLAVAAKKAGFTPIVEESAHHPSIPYKTVGRVLVKKADGKEATIRAVAEKMGHKE
jgi:signal recognition particle subunit SRP19